MSLVLRKVKAGYRLEDIREKVNHLLFMDDLKLYGQNEKQIQKLVNTVRIFSIDIKQRHWNKCLAFIMKREIISKSEGIQLPNDEFIKNINKE